MGAKYKELAKIEYVTDTDVGYYKMGEINFSYEENEIRDYLQCYGLT